MSNTKLTARRKMVMIPANSRTFPRFRYPVGLSMVSVPAVSTVTVTAETIAKRIFGKVLVDVLRRLHRPWATREVDYTPEEWDRLERNSQGFDTHALMISCGTVTMDQPESADQRRILLVWNRKVCAWQLPKGRRDVHEDFGAAALRETTEETGVAVRPLYLRFGTRFTLPGADCVTEEEEEKEELQARVGALRVRPCLARDSGAIVNNGIVSVLNKDIFYVSVYPDPSTGATRHIYWYAAKPQSTTTPRRELMGKEDLMKMKMRWFSAEEAVHRLKMTVEKEAVTLAVHYANQMSEEEWAHSQRL